MAEYAAVRASGLKLKGGKKLTAKRSAKSHSSGSGSSSAAARAAAEAEKPLRHGASS